MGGGEKKLKLQEMATETDRLLRVRVSLHHGL